MLKQMVAIFLYQKGGMETFVAVLADRNTVSEKAD